MNVYTQATGDATEITITLKGRDDLERAIPWLPTLRVLFPYPDPPKDEDTSANINMGGACPPPLCQRATE